MKVGITLKFLQKVTPFYSFIFQIISTAHEHKLFKFKNLTKNFCTTSCLFLSHHITTCHIYISFFFKFKKLHKNIPVYLCILPGLNISNFKKKHNKNIPVTSCILPDLSISNLFKYKTLTMYTLVNSCLLPFLYIPNDEYCT